MVPQRVLITGCGGMLGGAIYEFFRMHSPVVVATDKILSESMHRQLDVRDTHGLRAIMSDLRPDLVLHLAAETDLEWCEEHPEGAAAVNADATRTIAELCEDARCTLVYISTAGVFDGRKETFYTEEDKPNPIMVYGQTKFDGENHVRNLCAKHYVVRAGWMVGGGPKRDHKFVRRILEQLEEGRRVIHAVNDRLGTPTYTHDFAMNLFTLLGYDAYGTYHMVCEGSGSRFDVAVEIVRIFGDESVMVASVDSSFFKEQYPAPRPRSEMLINAKLRHMGINQMRRWRDALREYIEREYLSDRGASLESESTGTA